MEMGESKMEVMKTNRVGRPLANYRKDLLEKHGRKCGYCDSELTVPESIEIDHFFPTRTHPQCHGLDNLVLTCPVCNRIKGAKEPIADDGSVVILHPYRDNYWEQIKIDSNGLAYGVTEEGKNTVETMRLNRSELVAYRADKVAVFIGEANEGEYPAEIYYGSVRQIKKLMEITIDDSELAAYCNRMIYANVIASMEAYLSKTIIRAVTNDKNTFWRFVSKFEWGKERFSLNEIKEVYDGMYLRVQTALTEALYHKLPKVKNIYKDTLGIEILTDEEEMGALCRAVEIRHDIVHRNGRKSACTEQNDYHIITTDMVNDLILRVNKLVSTVEEQLRAGIQGAI